MVTDQITGLFLLVQYGITPYHVQKSSKRLTKAYLDNSWVQCVWMPLITKAIMGSTIRVRLGCTTSLHWSYMWILWPALNTISQSVVLIIHKVGGPLLRSTRPYNMVIRKIVMTCAQCMLMPFSGRHMSTSAHLYGTIAFSFCHRSFQRNNFQSISHPYVALEDNLNYHCLLHDLSTAKLSAYVMCPDAVRLLINYLRGRKRRVIFFENTGK